MENALKPENIDVNLSHIKDNGYVYKYKGPREPKTTR